MEAVDGRFRGKTGDGAKLAGPPVEGEPWALASRRLYLSYVAVRGCKWLYVGWPVRFVTVAVY